MSSPWCALDRPTCRDNEHDRRDGDGPDSDRRNSARGRGTQRGNETIDRGERREGRDEHTDLSKLDADVESKQWQRDVLHEKAAKVIREPCAVDESKDAGEDRPVAANAMCPRAISNEQVLEPGGNDRHRNQKLDER